jgi:hypothetical protein
MDKVDKISFLKKWGWTQLWSDDNWIKNDMFLNNKIDIDRAGLSTDMAYNITISNIKRDNEIKRIILRSKYKKNMERERYAVYEKEPAHVRDKNGIILAPFNTKEEAEIASKKYGYYGDNYYIDIINN